MNEPTLYLTVNEDGEAFLWTNKPRYFSTNLQGRWNHPIPELMSNGSTYGHPLLNKIAAAFGIKPGSEGIMEVTMEIKPAA